MVIVVSGQWSVVSEYAPTTDFRPAPEFTLASVTNGASTTTLQTTLQSLAAAPHAIHMHKSADEISVYVACADINPASLPRTGEADSPIGLISGAAGLSLLGVGLLLRRRARAPKPVVL